jgi:hypothetical protein
MMIMRPCWLMPKVSPRRPTRLPQIMLELRALKKMPKLMRTLEELRCEGVNFNALELVFFKDALAHLRIHIFCEMEQILGQYPS